MPKKISRAEKIRRFITANPAMSTSQVAAEFGVKYQIAYMAKRHMERRAEMERRRAKDNWNTVMGASLNESAVDKATNTTGDQNLNGMNAEERAEFMRRVAAQPRHRMQGAAPEGIDATLADRGNKYGKFVDHATVTQKLKRVLHNHANEHNKSFALDQAEALDMICHKMGRIVNGDPDYADSWIDIAGYAKLVADRLETGKTV